jgi:hypothetical protein
MSGWRMTETARTRQIVHSIRFPQPQITNPALSAGLIHHIDDAGT